MTINLEVLETQAKKACSIDGVTPPCIFVQSEVILALIARIRELEATNAHQAKVIEHYTARGESLKTTLTMIADRVDDFVYDELASDIEDVALDVWGETYESVKKRLEATIQRVRSSHQNEDGYCVKCSEEYGLTTGTYPCPPIQALEECTQ